MGGLSLPHIIILMVILLVFFGPGKLPQLGESLGKAIRGFKEGLDETNKVLNQPASNKAESPPASTAQQSSQPLPAPEAVPQAGRPVAVENKSKETVDTASPETVSSEKHGQRQG